MTSENLDDIRNTCHILPCHIDYQGPIDVTKLQIKYDSEAGLYKCKLRGRTLTGRKLDLAEHNMTGFATSSAEGKPVLVPGKNNADSVIVWSYSADQPDLGKNIADLMKFSNAMMNE